MTAAPATGSSVAASGYVVPYAEARVVVDGKDVTDKVRPRLSSLRISERRGERADEVEITLDDTDGLLAIPPRGASMSVSLGWARGTGLTLGQVDKGSFTVDEAAHTGPPDQVTVRGRSADLTAGFAKRRDASYRETTLGAVVKQIAGRHGLKPACHPSLAAIAVPILGQSSQSDMAALRVLGRRHDAVATVKGGSLILAPIGAASTAAGSTIPAATIAAVDCSSHDYRLVAREDNDGVEAAWHDQGTATRRIVSVGGTKKPRRLRRTYATEADARHAATGQLARQQRAEATLELVLAYGRPEFYPDRPITVTGFKAEICARKWIIASVDHAIDVQGGMTSRVSLEGTT